MPKMKTHSSLKGRFKITGTGKVCVTKLTKTTCFPTNPNVQKRVLNATCYGSLAM